MSYIVLMNKQIPTIVSPSPMKATILAVSCFLILPLIAQEAAPRNVRPQIVPSGLTQRSEEVESLKKNITIRLHGTTTTGTEIDLSLSGIGPRFRCDQVVNDDTMLSCEYLVSETETGYKVSYTVSARIKASLQNSPGLTGYENRDISTSGTVLCSTDRPQVLVSNGSKPLQLTITED